MRDDTVLAAIDAALRSPAFCACGTNLTIAVHGDAVWLECAAFAAPTRWPVAIGAILRDLLHDRRFVVDLPAPDVKVPRRVSLPPKTGSAVSTPV